MFSAHFKSLLQQMQTYQYMQIKFFALHNKLWQLSTEKLNISINFSVTNNNLLFIS